MQYIFRERIAKQFPLLQYDYLPCIHLICLQTEILAELARKRSLKLAAKRLASVTVLVKRKMMSDGSPIAPVRYTRLSNYQLQLLSALQVAQKMMKQYKIRLSPDQIKLPNIEQLTTFGNHQLKVTIEGDELPLNVLVKQL